MSLEKFQEKNKKKNQIIIFTILCVMLITGVFLYQSYALFEAKENFNMINGNTENPGDLYFAYYVDEKITQDMPTKDSGYVFSEKSSCNNGVTIAWDEEEWMAKVYYKNYKKETNSRTKCTLYFEERKEPPKPSDEVKDYIIANAPEGTILLDDETEDHNMRFIGSNPNNYIDIGDRDASGNIILWRIIGAMNNIKSSEEDTSGETRLKITRSSSIGGYSWSESGSNMNSGYGVNEWSISTAMKLMNPGYDTLSVGGSLYWNSNSGKCYSNMKNTTVSCDFTSSGISENAKSFIGDTLWNTGSNGSEMVYNTIVSKDFYRLERSNNTGDGCSYIPTGSTWHCEDQIPRTTKWVGKVGLIYPSDYGYSTSSSSEDGRKNCIEEVELCSWNSGLGVTCRTNTWIKPQWTMTPTELDSKSCVFYVYSNSLGRDYTYYNKDIFPTVYLKSNIKITSGEGTSESPFVASLTE